MPKESFKNKKLRTSKIIKGLEKTYPDAHCELDYKNSLELLVATILSAQCTDKRVNMVTPHLFRQCKTVEDYVRLPQDELEAMIRSTGFFRNKAKNIRACAQAMLDRHDGEIPETMEDLHKLPGIGRKTANVILGNAFNKNEGVVVDTHVQRITGRLKLSVQGTPEKIEQDLMKLVPVEKWCLFSHLLIWHGRRRCDARKPDCDNCEISRNCPTKGKHGQKKTRSTEYST